MFQKRCHQCPTPAVLELNGRYLCLDCYAKFQQASYQNHVILASTLNVLLDDVNDIAGLPRSGGRIQIPTPTTINTGDTTFNNIRVSESIVGTINTGNVEKIDSRVSAMQGEKRDDLAKAIQHLTQAIVDAPDLEPNDKDSALECLSFLSDQAITPEGERTPSVGKTIISKLEQILANAGSIASIWSQVAPHISNLF